MSETLIYNLEGNNFDYYTSMIQKIKNEDIEPIAVFLGECHSLDESYSEERHLGPIDVNISIYVIDNKAVGIIKIINVKGRSLSIQSHAIDIHASRFIHNILMESMDIKIQQTFSINPILCKTLKDNQINANLRLIPFKVNDSDSYFNISCSLFTGGKNHDKKLSSGIFELPIEQWNEWNKICKDYAYKTHDNIEQYGNYIILRMSLMEEDLKSKKLQNEKTQLEIDKLRFEIKQLDKPHF